jgi:hypothetical protein
VEATQRHRPSARSAPNRTYIPSRRNAFTPGSYYICHVYVLTSEAPFPASYSLNAEHLKPHPSVSTYPSSETEEHITYIPGNPAINLIPADVNAYLSCQLETPLLDELYDKLWVVARTSGKSIDVIHT